MQISCGLSGRRVWSSFRANTAVGVDRERRADWAKVVENSEFVLVRGREGGDAAIGPSLGAFDRRLGVGRDEFPVQASWNQSLRRRMRCHGMQWDAAAAGEQHRMGWEEHGVTHIQPLEVLEYDRVKQRVSGADHHGRIWLAADMKGRVFERSVQAHVRLAVLTTKPSFRRGVAVRPGRPEGVQRLDPIKAGHHEILLSRRATGETGAFALFVMSTPDKTLCGDGGE